jgi:hypothetical protein
MPCSALSKARFVWARAEQATFLVHRTICGERACPNPNRHRLSIVHNTHTIPPVATPLCVLLPTRITIPRKIVRWVHCIRITLSWESVVPFGPHYYCATEELFAGPSRGVETSRRCTQTLLVIAGLLATRQAVLVVLFGRARVPAACSILVALARAKLDRTRDFATGHDANGGNVGIVGTDFAVAPRHDALGRWR